MDSAPLLDPIVLGVLLLAYVGLGLVWLRLALGSRRE